MKQTRLRNQAASEYKHLFIKNSDSLLQLCTSNLVGLWATTNRKFQEGNPIASTNDDRYSQSKDCETLFREVKSPLGTFTTGIYTETKFPLICRK